MAEREKIGQIGYNPFLTQNNYIDDLMIQDKFLRPVNAKLMDEGLGSGQM
jgi:heme oxygenase